MRTNGSSLKKVKNKMDIIEEAEEKETLPSSSSKKPKQKLSAKKSSKKKKKDLLIDNQTTTRKKKSISLRDSIDELKTKRESERNDKKDSGCSKTLIKKKGEVFLLKKSYIYYQNK